MKKITAVPLWVLLLLMIFPPFAFTIGKISEKCNPTKLKTPLDKYTHTIGDIVPYFYGKDTIYYRMNPVTYVYERFYFRCDTLPLDKFGLRSIQDSIFRKKRDSVLLIHKKH